MKILPQGFNFYIFLLMVLLTSGVCTILAQKAVKSYAESTSSIDDQIAKKKAELEDKNSEISKVRAKANQISASIEKMSHDLNATQSQVNALQLQLDDLTSDIDNLKKKLDIKKIELDDKNKIKDVVLRNVYMESQKNILQLLLSRNTFAESAQNTSYHLAFINDSNNLIGEVNSEIKIYEDTKKEVETIKAQIEIQKKTMVTLAAKIASQVLGAKTDLKSVSQQQLSLQQEKADIEKKLGELSAQQRSVLDEKTKTFTTSVGEIPSTGEASSRADYNPGFKDAYAGFSFGAPHRKGMSQYGAKGRAEAGQSYKDILMAYYGDVEVKEVDGIPDNIKTDKGTMSFEGKYLKGLAEMPASWPTEALKAQAVAGRTYALASIGWRMSNKSAGGSICTTESCQVWSSSKAANSGNWGAAATGTKSQILVSKKTGEIFAPYYAASSGGYNYSFTSLGHTTSGGWDTKCGSQSCWTSPNESYEAKGGSPWFYKGWYKTRSNASCGRSHPWLTEEEFADIVGAVSLYKDNSNNQKHLSQVDAKKCWSKDISDTWSKSDVQSKSGIKSIESVSVSYSSGGYTSEVKIKTNKGELTFSGSDFKAIFNLRAPGAIQIKSAVFNIEHK